MPEPTKRRRLRPVLALALLAGLGAGALGVYVIESRSGNETASASCPANDALHAALDETARGEVAAMVPLDQPFDASSLRFQDTNGADTTIGAMRGQTLLVNLWATWCAPCRAEMPALDALEREAGDESFAVVAVNLDMGDEEKPRDFYREIAIESLPFFRDSTMRVFNDLRAQGQALGLPFTMLVDAEGCARAAMNGAAHWSSPDAFAMIDALKAHGAGTQSTAALYQHP